MKNLSCLNPVQTINNKVFILRMSKVLFKWASLIKHYNKKARQLVQMLQEETKKLSKEEKIKLLDDWSKSTTEKHIIIKFSRLFREFRRKAHGRYQ